MGTEHQNKILRVIIHCTASNDEASYGLEQINNDHKIRGFSAFDGVTFCGYHYIVRKSGEVQRGRPESIVGAHTVGHNTGSLAVVWEGTYKMTTEQRTALIRTVLDIMLRHGLTTDDVFPHCAFTTEKTCPNFIFESTFISFEEFRKALREEVRV